MAKARYMDIILLVSICRSLCIRSSGMLALLSQMSQSLSMGTCIHASMWVRIRGCLRVCDVHVCVLCALSTAQWGAGNCTSTSSIQWRF